VNAGGGEVYGKRRCDIELCASELSRWRPAEIWMHASKAPKSEAHPEGVVGLRPIPRWVMDKMTEEGGIT